MHFITHTPPPPLPYDDHLFVFSDRTIEMDIHSVVYFTNFSTNVLNCSVKFYTANSGKIHSKVSGTDQMWIDMSKTIGLNFMIYMTITIYYIYLPLGVGKVKSY